MNIFPAIDLSGGRAVRLLRGDYRKMTVYDDNPPAVAESFASAGAEYLHVVDLDGAKDGTTANASVIEQIISSTGLKVEVGGGVRSEEVVARYLEAGAWRVILGTAAITSPGFVREMAQKYGDRIAVGIDARDGMVAIKGWTEISNREIYEFCQQMQEDGVRGVICTDISKDGAMQGTNLKMYERLKRETKLNIVASGGISSLADVRALTQIGVWGAILGKALYTGGIDLSAAILTAREADA